MSSMTTTESESRPPVNSNWLWRSLGLARHNHPGRYTLLLVSILLMLIVQPIFVRHTMAQALALTTMSLVLLSALFTLNVSRTYFVLGIILALPALISRGILQFERNEAAKVIVAVTASAFIMVTVISVVHFNRRASLKFPATCATARPLSSSTIIVRTLTTSPSYSRNSCPSGPAENAFDVLNRAIGIALSPELKGSQHTLDISWRPGQEKPALGIDALAFHICGQLGGAIVFGIYSDRNHRETGTELRGKILGDTRHFPGQRPTRPGTTGVDEVDQNRLAFERRQADLMLVLIYQ